MAVGGREGGGASEAGGAGGASASASASYRGGLRGRRRGTSSAGAGAGGRAARRAAAGLPRHGLPHRGQELCRKRSGEKPSAFSRQTAGRTSPLSSKRQTARTMSSTVWRGKNTPVRVPALPASITVSLAPPRPSAITGVPASPGLHGHDAEILLGGEHKGPGALHVVDEYLGRLVAQHPHVERQHGRMRAKSGPSPITTSRLSEQWPAKASTISATFLYGTSREAVR